MAAVEVARSREAYPGAEAPVVDDLDLTSRYLGD
jgi:hypothetical protein